MAEPRPTTPARRPDIHSVKAVDVFHPSWWVGGAVLLLLALLFIRLLITNENLQWSVVWQYLFSREILAGLGRTLMLTFLSMILGLIIGTVIAIMRLSRNPVFRATSWAWIWFFRGVPPLVQLVFWYNLGLLIPEVSIGIPFGPELWSAPTNQLITPLSAALLGLAFTESAYAAEMIRAGIQAINVGQTEAAATLGMTQAQTLRRIVLPQALRIIIPPIGNDTISMLKFTSLVSVLALPDLLYSAQMIYSRTYQTIPLLIVATIWYLVLSTVLTFVEHYIEHRLKDDTPLDFRLVLRSLFKSKFWGLRRGEVLP
jgi:polar amino acid transport system permease protein